MRQPDFGSPIVSLQELAEIRPTLGTVVATSGGFDPIHPGHISCIVESKPLGDALAVIVNGDAFLRVKKGRPFQDLATRCLIVSALRGVDYVVPFEVENDSTVSDALELIKPNVFTKGGDRIDEASIPEWETCKRHNIEVVTGVGLDKQWSSSAFLQDWADHTRR
jgi:cytidyltransferase-like protein